MPRLIAFLVVVFVAVVAARPTDVDKENVDVRQGYNQPGYPAAPSAYPQPGPYPASSNSRPAYAYDNAFPDQVNFSNANSAHAGISSLINANLPPAGFLAPIQPHQIAGFAPTGYQAPSGISASAVAVGRV